MEANMDMDRFIRSQNVSRYRRLIESVSEDGSVTWFFAAHILPEQAR
jgi:hypothetical protein